MIEPCMCPVGTDEHAARPVLNSTYDLLSKKKKKKITATAEIQKGVFRIEVEFSQRCKFTKMFTTLNLVENKYLLVSEHYFLFPQVTPMSDKNGPTFSFHLFLFESMSSQLTQASWCTQVRMLTFPHMQHAPKSLSRTSVSALSRYHGSQPRRGARDIIEIKMMDEQSFEESSGKERGIPFMKLDRNQSVLERVRSAENLRLSASDHNRADFSFLTESSAAYDLRWNGHKTKKMLMYISAVGFLI